MPLESTTMPLPLMLFLLCIRPAPPPTAVLSLNQEGLYLHQFKLSLHDPDSRLSSWNPCDPTPCRTWFGVLCDTPTNTTVTALDLSQANLAGPFPTHILCRLPNLTSINLFNNSINSTLPLDISLCKPFDFFFSLSSPLAFSASTSPLIQEAWWMSGMELGVVCNLGIWWYLSVRVSVVSANVAGVLRW